MCAASTAFRLRIIIIIVALAESCTRQPLFPECTPLQCHISLPSFGIEIHVIVGRMHGLYYFHCVHISFFLLESCLESTCFHASMHIQLGVQATPTHCPANVYIQVMGNSLQIAIISVSRLKLDTVLSKMYSNAQAATEKTPSYICTRWSENHLRFHFIDTATKYFVLFYLSVSNFSST